MKFVRKLFCPAGEWKPLADDLGWQFVPAKFFLNSGQIHVAHGQFPITVKEQIGETEDGDDPGRFTKVAVEARIQAGVELMLFKNWPGVKLMRRILPIPDQTTSLQNLDDKCVVLARDAKHAEQVFDTPEFASAVTNAPKKLKAIVRCESRGQQVPHTADIHLLTPGILTDREQLSSMVALMQLLLKNLLQAGYLSEIPSTHATD